jgi:hypothetical protein
MVPNDMIGVPILVHQLFLTTLTRKYCTKQSNIIIAVGAKLELRILSGEMLDRRGISIQGGTIYIAGILDQPPERLLSPE